MVKPTYTIALAAVLMVAAFAGVALIDDEADAANAGEVTAVSYSGSGITTSNDPVASNATSITIKDGTSSAGPVLYWTSNSGAIYYIGQVVSLADIDASELEGTVFDLTAVVGDEESSYATIVIDDVSYIVPITAASEGKLVTTDSTYAVVKAIVDGFKDEGYLLTWTASDPFASDASIAADAEFELTYSVGKVNWNTDANTTINYTDIESAGDAATVTIPDAPVMTNHTFLGWATSIDGEVVIDYIATTDKYYIDGEEVDTIDVSDAEAGVVTYYAVFDPVQFTVTFMADDKVVGTSIVDYGTTVMNPALPEGYVAWAVDAEGTASFDFDQPIVADVTVYAVAAVPSDVFTVTFVVDGEVIATYASNSVTLPDAPSKEGFEFVGWSINNAVISDPVNYEFTADTQFVALFQAIDVTTYTVTIQMADGTTQNIEVAEGDVPELPALAEGKVWALGDEIFNPETAIATDIVLKEVDEYYTVSFAVNGTVYDAYAQEVKYGEKASAPAQFVFPDGYSGWDFNFNTIITSDVTVNAALIPAPAEEPAFYKTTTGQVAIVIVVFALLFFGYAVHSNMGGIKDKLFGYTISKKEKKE